MRTTQLLLTAVLASAVLYGQNISSTVKGTVHDPTGGTVPNAECTLTNQGTHLQVTVKTANDGSFVFLDVLAGTYAVSVRASGFKTFVERDIVVTSSEFHPLNDITLSVGATSESVTVT